MSYEDIVILRRLAMQRVEKERALAEVRDNSLLGILHVHVFALVLNFHRFYAYFYKYM